MACLLTDRFASAQPAISEFDFQCWSSHGFDPPGDSVICGRCCELVDTDRRQHPPTFTQLSCASANPSSSREEAMWRIGIPPSQARPIGQPRMMYEFAGFGVQRAVYGSVDRERCHGVHQPDCARSFTCNHSSAWWLPIHVRCSGCAEHGLYACVRSLEDGHRCLTHPCGGGGSTLM